MHVAIGTGVGDTLFDLSDMWSLFFGGLGVCMRRVSKAVPPVRVVEEAVRGIGVAADSLRVSREKLLRVWAPPTGSEPSELHNYLGRLRNVLKELMVRSDKVDGFSGRAQRLAPIARQVSSSRYSGERYAGVAVSSACLLSVGGISGKVSLRYVGVSRVT